MQLSPTIEAEVLAMIVVVEFVDEGMYTFWAIFDCRMSPLEQADRKQRFRLHYFLSRVERQWIRHSMQSHDWDDVYVLELYYHSFDNVRYSMEQLE